MAGRHVGHHWRGRVIVRSRCLLVRDGRVLLQREKNGVYSVPGGRLEFLESLPFTVVREMREEAGMEVEPLRLVYVVESLSERKGRQRHEILFYFKCRGEGEPRRGHESIVFEWRNPLEVAERFWPRGLAEIIAEDMPGFERARYIVYVDERLSFINTFEAPMDCARIVAPNPYPAGEASE